MGFIHKREFVAAALDENAKMFVVSIATLSTALTIYVYPLCQAQIGLLVPDKPPGKVLPKYLDYADVFLFDYTIKLPKNTSMNKYAIKLVENKQPPYRLIFSLASVEQETLKTYIETYLKTGFISPSKSLANAFIFFDQKQDRSLCLLIDTIKNWYPLPLIEEALDQLDWAKRFIQLDLINTYQKMRIEEDDK